MNREQIKNERIRQLLNKMENTHSDLNNGEKRKTESERHLSI